MADSAHTINLSRRCMFGRVPLAALATTVIIPSAARAFGRPSIEAEASDSLFQKWEREWARRQEAADASPNMPEHEFDGLISEQTVFERLILKTPSATRRSAQIKARFAHRYVQGTMMEDLVPPLEHILAALSA